MPTETLELFPDENETNKKKSEDNDPLEVDENGEEKELEEHIEFPGSPEDTAIFEKRLQEERKAKEREEAVRRTDVPGRMAADPND